MSSIKLVALVVTIVIVAYFTYVGLCDVYLATKIAESTCANIRIPFDECRIGYDSMAIQFYSRATIEFIPLVVSAFLFPVLRKCDNSA